jgi:hypothetical protein
VYAVEQVVIGADGQLYHRYRSRAGFWSPWSLLPGHADPAGGITVNGRTGVVEVTGVGVLTVTGTDGDG